MVALSQTSEQLSDKAASDKAADMKSFFEHGKTVIQINKLHGHKYTNGVVG